MGSTDCLPAGATSGQGERTRYFSRQLITADDLTQDQRYHRDKRRLHNRLLHGWGIVCGLEVKPNKRSGAPLNVTICPGYALSPQGDEIYVPAEVQFDLDQCIAGQDAPCHHPCATVTSRALDSAKEFYVAIKYAECLSHPVRVSPIGCGCDDTACEYSRIRDGFEIGCVDAEAIYKDAPLLNSSACEKLQHGEVIQCTPCLTTPWVVLAKIKIYEVDGTTLNETPVTYDDSRRILLSTAVMQGHILSTCAL